MAKKRELGFVDSVESYRTIIKNLQKGNFSSLYVLTGDEPYFIDKISDYIATNALPEEQHDFNQDIIYGNEYNAASVIEYSRTYPMMSDKRVVIVREAAQMNDFNKLETYFESPVETTILVICYKGKKIDKRSGLYKKTIENGVFFESVTARDYEIKDYLGEMIMLHGCTIDTKAKELLVEHLGCDLKKIDNEIIKLLNAMKDGDRKITCSHIETYIGISKDYNLFEMTTAIGVKDMQKTLKIASYFESNAKNNPLVVTIPSLFKYFLAVFCIGMVIFEHTKKNKPLPNHFELARMAKLPGAYFVDKYIAASRIYPPTKTLKILGVIRESDMKSKGVGTGSLTDGEILRELLLKIFLL